MPRHMFIAVMAATLANLGGHILADETFKTIDNAELRRQSVEDCTYTFTEKIDGKSLVVIHAPKGTVKFVTAPAGLDEGSKIDGGSKVLIEADTVIFNAKIDSKSIVFIVLSKNGKIEVNDKIDGEAIVYWCKADDADPEPTLKTKEGNPRGKGKYNQVTRAEMQKLIKEYGLK